MWAIYEREWSKGGAKVLRYVVRRVMANRSDRDPQSSLADQLEVAAGPIRGKIMHIFTALS